MYAGLFIAVAAIVYVRCDNQLVGSVLFSVGLLSCVCYKLYLCTGRANRPWRSLICKDPYPCSYSFWTELVLWLALYAINCFFALTFGLIAKHAIDVSKASDIVATKISHPWYWILFMGLLCGLLIQAGVHAARKSVGGLAMVVLCVTAFLMLGGEHCVADAAFIGMAQLSDWSDVLGCLKLVSLAGAGNLLAGLPFYDEW